MKWKERLKTANPESPGDYQEIIALSENWQTCAVGEHLGFGEKDIHNNKGREKLLEYQDGDVLEVLGIRFHRLLTEGKVGRATETLEQIQNIPVKLK